MRLYRMIPLAGVLLAVASAALFAAPPIGSAAPDFTLTTLAGKSFSLTQAAKGHKAVVVMFVIPSASNAYNDRMRDMAALYEKQGILFVASTATRPSRRTSQRCQATRLCFPLRRIPTTRSRTSTTHGTARDLRRRSAGSSCITAASTRTGGSDQGHLAGSRNALDQLLAGKPIAKAETKRSGCSIKRVGGRRNLAAHLAGAT